MQVHRLSYGIKGFVKLARYAIRWTHMITETAKHRLKVLTFWKQYSLQATLVAFDVSRRTLFNWQATLKRGENKIEALNERSKHPQIVRRRVWSKTITDQIRLLREKYSNLGKDKIQVLLALFC